MSDHERGAALIVALLATALLTALGVSLLVLSDTERRMAANVGFSNETFYGSEAGMERAVQDLALATGWNGILSGAEHSSFADLTQRPTLTSGETIDLNALTTELQAASNAEGTFGANTPVWRLFAWGPLAGLAPAGVIDSAQYVVVWVADDPAEVDGDPSVDTNGMVTVHAEAYGLGGARRVVEATLARVSAGVVRMVSWREVR